MSAWIACRKSCAAAGNGTAVAQVSSKAAKSLVRMSGTSLGGDDLDHVEQGFEMRMRQHHAPAMLADPLEQADHVALGVPAIAIGERLVAELQRTQEDHAPAAIWKEDPDRSLRTVEHGEMQAGAFRADSAGARFVGREGGVSWCQGAELHRSAPI